MFSRSGFAEIVDHCFQILKRSRRISPQVSSVRLLVAWLEHRHRRLVGVQHGMLEHLGGQRVDQGLQLHAAFAHPLRQGRACDGVTGGGDCQTERRTSGNGYFPTAMSPKENPFYLDLPFDDINNRNAFGMRASVVPWANDAAYRGNLSNQNFSVMKNRWVMLRKAGRVCYGQIQDAGPGVYDDAGYVFGSNDQRPANSRYNGAGMDVSPALNGCLGFADLNGDGDRVDWKFVEASDVPAGPWRRIVTTSGVRF